MRVLIGFRKAVFAWKKECSTLQVVQKKLYADCLFLLLFFFCYVILMVRTPRLGGSDPYSRHKRKSTREEADFGCLRKALFREGIQTNHAVGNQRKGRRILQPVSKYFPRQGRSIDGTC